MTRQRWTFGFLAVTILAVALELVAACDSNPDTAPWTHLIVDNVPAPLTFLAIGVLVLWLPWHFWVEYRKRRERDGVG